MKNIRTHYDNLKVARNAPPEVIRAAYKTLSQKHHPDRNGNSAESQRVMKIINDSYAVLSDPVARRKHDAWIIEQESPKTSEGRFQRPQREVEFRPPVSVIVNKVVAFPDHAASATTEPQSPRSLGGFSQVGPAWSQFRVSLDHRAGFLALAS
ncbi:MAG: hypothetical protein CME40_01505 [Haliea sp.]|nr:hypothetical protein [Haliea sp.]